MEKTIKKYEFNNYNKILTNQEYLEITLYYINETIEKRIKQIEEFYINDKKLREESVSKFRQETQKLINEEVESFKKNENSIHQHSLKFTYKGSIMLFNQSAFTIFQNLTTWKN